MSFQLQDTLLLAYFLLSFGRTGKHKWDQTRLQTSRQCFWQGLFRVVLSDVVVASCLVVGVVVVVDYCGSCSIMTIIITERVCVLSVNRQRPGKRPVTSEISCVQVEVAKGSLTGIQSAVRSSLHWAGLICPFKLFVPVLSSLRIAAIIQDLSKLPNILTSYSPTTIFCCPSIFIIINTGFFPGQILQNFWPQK